MINQFNSSVRQNLPDSKVHGANMGPILGRQTPGGPHVGPMNFAIWEFIILQFGYFCKEIRLTGTITIADTYKLYEILLILLK